mmetsp:Transcript_41427/g.86954  ORF Transcript_41427/g.86954 Transcript_41427/m.86954 type:complete len:206 (+) Transcript_41427:241-858(+)
MIRSRSKTFFTTQERSIILPIKAFLRTHQISKEFPSGRSDEAGYTPSLGHDIQRGTGWHRPRHTVQPTLTCELRNGFPIIANQRHTIRGGDEKSSAGNEVAIAIAIVRRSQCRQGTLILHIRIGTTIGSQSHLLHQLRSVRQIRIGMTFTKVRQWIATHERRGRQAQLLDEDALGEFPPRSVHAVEYHGESIAGAKGSEGIEVEA